MPTVALEWDHETTLEDAREFLQESIFENLTICPCCERPDKVYSRLLTKSSMQDIANLYRETFLRGHEPVFIHYHDFAIRVQSEYPKLRHIGLIEQGEQGYWRITPNGVAFVEGTIRIQERIVTYHNRYVGSDGPFKYIHEIWNRFNFDELMSVRPPAYLTFSDTRPQRGAPPRRRRRRRT